MKGKKIICFPITNMTRKRRDSTVKHLTKYLPKNQPSLLKVVASKTQRPKTLPNEVFTTRHEKFILFLPFFEEVSNETGLKSYNEDDPTNVFNLPKTTTEHPNTQLLQISPIEYSQKYMKEFHTVSEAGQFITERIDRTWPILPQFIEGSIPQQIGVHCWHCCFPFNNTPIPYPENYHNGKFKCKGVFCSFNCVLAWHLQYHGGSTSLIYYLRKKWHGKEMLSPIKPAPPKEVLNIFGGPLTIQEFRLNFEMPTETINILKHPIVFTNDSVHKIMETVKRRVI